VLVLQQHWKSWWCHPLSRRDSHRNQQVDSLISSLFVYASLRKTFSLTQRFFRPTKCVHSELCQSSGCYRPRYWWCYRSVSKYTIEQLDRLLDGLHEVNNQSSGSVSGNVVLTLLLSLLVHSETMRLLDSMVVMAVLLASRALGLRMLP